MQRQADHDRQVTGEATLTRAEAERRLRRAEAALENATASLGSLVARGALEDQCAGAVGAVDRAERGVMLARAALVAIEQDEDVAREAQVLANRARAIETNIAREQRRRDAFNLQAAALADLVSGAEMLDDLVDAFMKPTLSKVRHALPPGKRERLARQLHNDAEACKVRMAELSAELAELAEES